MQIYVVLLRGINVGGNNLVPMKQLKSVLIEQGFNDVQTYIQSGNLILSSAENPAELIANLIRETFAVEASVISLPAEEFHNIAASNPYPNQDGKRVHFYFCDGLPQLDTERASKYQGNGETFTLVGKVLYLHAPDGIGRSKLVANMESCLGVTTTGRNLNTVNKLLMMLPQD